jgi:hypothetical protein
MLRIIKKNGKVFDRPAGQLSARHGAKELYSQSSANVQISSTLDALVIYLAKKAAREDHEQSSRS